MSQTEVDEIARLRQELAEHEHSFDLRWKADIRAIKMWQKAHPGREHVWHPNKCGKAFGRALPATTALM